MLLHSPLQSVTKEQGCYFSFNVGILLTGSTHTHPVSDPIRAGHSIYRPEVSKLTDILHFPKLQLASSLAIEVLLY